MSSLSKRQHWQSSIGSSRRGNMQVRLHWDLDQSWRVTKRKMPIKQLQCVISPKSKRKGFFHTIIHENWVQPDKSVQWPTQLQFLKQELHLQERSQPASRRTRNCVRMILAAPLRSKPSLPLKNKSKQTMKLWNRLKVLCKLIGARFLQQAGCRDSEKVLVVHQISRTFALSQHRKPNNTLLLYLTQINLRFWLLKELSQKWWYLQVKLKHSTQFRVKIQAL